MQKLNGVATLHQATLNRGETIRWQLIRRHSITRAVVHVSSTVINLVGLPGRRTIIRSEPVTNYIKRLFLV